MWEKVLGMVINWTSSAPTAYPRGAGGIPDNSNCPRRRFDLVIPRSPSNTWMLTPGWLSAYVEKIWDFFTGIVVPRLTSGVITPPAVSIPKLRGATSSSRTSLVASAAAPLKIPACTAAPYAYTKEKQKWVGRKKGWRNLPACLEVPYECNLPLPRRGWCSCSIPCHQNTLKADFEPWGYAWIRPPK